jgi:hypothetical protein
VPLSWQYRTHFSKFVSERADLERISRASKTLARMVAEEEDTPEDVFIFPKGEGLAGLFDTEDNRLVLLTGTLERFFNTIFRCSHTAKRRLVTPCPPPWRTPP